MNNDLISRSALQKRIINSPVLPIRGFGFAISCRSVDFIIESAPTIDAVDVVRCKDCKHRGIVKECPMCYTEDSYDDDYGYDYWDVDKTVDEGYCHCGEMDAEV